MQVQRRYWNIKCLSWWPFVGRLGSWDTGLHVCTRGIVGLFSFIYLTKTQPLKYDLFGGRPNSASIFVDFLLGVLGVCVSIRFELSRVVYMFFDTLMLLILFLSL